MSIRPIPHIKKAFSVLEMSIVLVVIALILASVMVGQNFVARARLDAIIADIKKISNSVEQFEKLYQGLPGDLANTAQLPTISALPAAVAGNGNGLVDTSAEALNFWLHLALSGLYPGNFDISSSYVPTNNTAAGGIPPGPIETSGYSVNNDATYGLTYVFSGFPSGTANYTTSIISPVDAYYIDNKIDDGNPDTGIVRAFDGSDVAAGSCKTANSYTISNSTAKCYMKFAASPPNRSAASVATCNGSVVGATRISPTSSCETLANAASTSVVGYVIEVCTNSGWTVLRYLCEPIKCEGGLSAGQTRSVPCPGGSTGSITQTCNQGGAYSSASYPNPQSACSLRSTTCTATDNIPNSGTTFQFPCPIGYTGSITYTCAANTYTLASNSCVPITCAGAVNLGATTNVASNTCPANYTNSTGDSVTICVHPTGSATTGNNRPSRLNYCMPTYSNACGVAGTTRDIGCPQGYTGTHTQKCNSAGYWEMVSNSCVEVTCGGDHIGAVRIAQGQTCACGVNGYLLEVCDYTDLVNYTTAAWQTSSVNCTPCVNPLVP
jgi:hypothetical protein